MEIVQISDLHFGGGSEFKLEMLEDVIDFINDLSPDVLVCTGDLVHKGRYRQYQGLSPILKKIEVPFLCVPGNHDAKNNGIIFFERFIMPRRSRLIIEDLNTILIGINSAKDDLSTGEIGDEQLLWLAKSFNKPLENRIIALHHHVIQVPYSGRKQTTLTDAGEILELTQLFQVDLVLMGHKHIPHAYSIGPTAFVYCGTSSSLKVRADEEPSFNHIVLNKGELKVEIINSTNFKREPLIIRKEGHTKFIRRRKTRIEHLINSSIKNKEYLL